MMKSGRDSLRKMFFVMLAITVPSCDTKRDAIVESKRNTVSEKVKIGDDIFAVKKRLEEAGLTIEYGPGFPTKNKDYLMMIVDYGVKPSGLETFKYTLGSESGGKLITGVITATPKGKVTSVE